MLAWIGVAFLACGRRNFNVDADVDVETGSSCVAPPAADCMAPQAYECNGTCWVTCENRATRPAAAAICAEWGGCLADIRNADDNNCAASRVTDVSWIGPQQSSTATSASNQWLDCHGNPASYFAWHSGQPDDANPNEDGEENCADLESGGTWTDATCGAALPFVCSRPL